MYLKDILLYLTFAKNFYIIRTIKANYHSVKRRILHMPKYIDIYQQIKKDYINNNSGDDTRFPSEYELMEKYSSSRTTIRHAMQMLRDQGLIVSRRGCGTEIIANFKSDAQKGQGARISEISNIYFNFVKSPTPVLSSSEPLVDIVPADEEEAKALEVEIGEGIYRIRWLHFADGIPYLYLTNFIRLDFAPDLPLHTSHLVALYPLLEKHWGLVFLDAEEIFTPSVSDFISSRLLEIPEGTPIMLLRRTARCQKGPLEFSRSLLRSDLIQISARLVNTGGVMF